MTNLHNNKSVPLSFNDILQLNRGGVYILYNEEEKKCQIFSSINMLSSISNIKISSFNKNLYDNTYIFFKNYFDNDDQEKIST